MQQSFTTPMMKQYVEIKRQYQDCLLFYRMGDFYELFMEDAHIGARVLNITLTSRAKGKDGRIPMAGVPYHAVDSYLNKLVKAGYKVAICEQMSPPNKYGIIDREVVRIVTPGTVIDEKALDKKENNYIISLAVDKKTLALSVADISTGYFSTTQIETDNLEQTLKDELARIHPAECILSNELYNDAGILRILKSEKEINIFPFSEWHSYASDAKEVLKKHFGVGTLASFDISDKEQSQIVSAALLGYLQQTQKGPVNHIKKIYTYRKNEHLILDRSTILNLELFSTIREHDTRGTLLSVLDQTKTAMGGRLIKQWMRKPLNDIEAINNRLDAVEFFLNEQKLRQILRETLKEANDIERLMSRLSVRQGNARDLVNLAISLNTVMKIKDLLKDLSPALTKSIEKQISPDIAKIIDLVDSHIVDEPPIALKEGGIIRTGIDKELDRLRDIVSGSRDWILELEKKEREKTGIASLKVRFNQVFGFYIEISKSNLHLVPDNYIRKQTLVNGERFITPELKEQEEIILTAEEKIYEMEYVIFQNILQQVLNQIAILQEAAQGISILDCLLSFAEIAEIYHYCRPKILYSGEVRIKGGRHPVVERLMENKQFVPNDLSLDNISQQLLLITGPNMAGKSVFIRQIALIVLMAQMGCFVPAEKAHISLVDRIFVRSGASDVITSGLSTFMVEMVETAHILHYATKNSLIIMDEIGRGTSTYDGISIAWAIAEYLVKNSKAPPKTLFATHYHELQVMEEEFPKQIKNFHMAVSSEREEPIFLYTLLPGGASHSFGIAVAKLAGLPEPVIKRAKELLEELENRGKGEAESVKKINLHPLPLALPPSELVDHVIHKELEKIDISQMTPLEALNRLAEMKEKLKLFKVQNADLVNVD